MKKILVIRFSSIGDIVLTSPVIRALKQQGKYRVHCLTKRRYAAIYQANPFVDKVHSFEEKISEVVKDLQNEGFDFVVDLQKNLRSFKIRWMLQKPDASFPKYNKEKWLLVNLSMNRLPEIHLVDRYFEAVKALGIHNDGKGLDFFIPEKEQIIPRQFNKHLQSAFVGFVIGGQHFTKLLPVEKAASIIKMLSIPVVLLGGPDDRNRGEEIATLCSNKQVINSCGQLSLFGSASLVQQAKVIVTNDTGLMHIAAAFQKPIISIWGNTVPAFGMFPYEPENPENVILSEVTNLSCRPCSKLGYQRCPKKHFRCMMEQDEQFIVREIERLHAK